MADEKTKPPPGLSGFKDLLTKLARVPKAEVDEKEREFQERQGIRPGKKTGLRR